MKVSLKTSRKQLQNSLQQHNRVWDQHFLQNGPLGAQRRLQAASVTPVWLPQAPFVSLWLPIGTA